MSQATAQIITNDSVISTNPARGYEVLGEVESSTEAEKRKLLKTHVPHRLNGATLGWKNVFNTYVP